MARVRYRAGDQLATLSGRIRSEMLEATRARSEVRRNTLRMLIAAVENRRIELSHELADEETLAVLQREAKQRRESIAEYDKGGRQDLVQQEQAELEIIQGFLPAMLTAEEVRRIAAETIAELGAAGPGDLGRVMRPLMGKLAGRADGRAANAAVRELLAG